MSLTLLIDLDDTLLSNDIDAFSKAYFKLLAETLETWVPAEKMMAAMKNAVQGMIEKNYPGLTMESQFDQIFYPQIGISKTELAETIEKFYAVKFPELGYFTSARPEAVNLIASVLREGWDVVVATNPLFPRSAIEHRLAWAGLSVKEYDFRLVTSYENLHFSKPHPAYYAEILGQLGWPEGPVVLVGNSLEEDILPAERTGIPTYWLHAVNLDSPGRNPHSRTGDLEHIFPWLKSLAEEQFQPDYQSVSAIFATLQSTPAVMDNLAKGLSLEKWASKPAENEWNLIENLAHLRDVDREVNFGRISRTIHGENPFLPGTNTDLWVQERNYAAEPGLRALEGFIQSRTNLLRLLMDATPEDLAQPARHAIFGPTTLQELLGFIATHDRTHIRQAMAAIQGAF
jgi:FMN phosphatase YigB (HAD superfamily)